MGMRGKKSYIDPQVFNYLQNEEEQQLYNALLNNNLLNRLYPEYSINTIDGNDDNFEGEGDAASQTSLNNLSLLEGINDIDQALNYEKRAPSGFVGMRGKRAPVGFMGMRGKKDEIYNDYLSNYEEKRGPVAGFLGTRGKKQPLVSQVLLV